MRLIICILCCTSSLLWWDATWARSLVVDQHHPAASDAGDGSSEHPWKSIAQAARAAQAGDTVTIKNGIYRERIEVARSGSSPDRMITFRSGGDGVIITGSDPVSGWRHWRGAIWKRDNWNVNSQQLFVDGEPLRQIGGSPLFSPKRLPIEGHDVTDLVSGTFYYDVKERTLYAWLKDGSDPARHLVEASVRPWLFLVKRKSYIRVTGLVFRHSNTTAEIGSGWPAVNISGDYCIVENTTVTWCDFTGLGGSGSHLTITGNRADYNGNSGMGFRGSDIVMRGNITNYNNYRNFDVGWHAGGIKNTEMKDSIITGHTAIGNRGQGIWCDVDCERVRVTASLVSGNTESGILYELSKGGTFVNNIVTGNGSVGIYLSASSGCSVLNNLLSGNYRGITLHGVPRFQANRKYRLRDNTVSNNIVIDSADASLVIAPDSDDAGTNRSDYNLFHTKGGSIFKRGYDRTFRGLTAWQLASGTDQHSKEALPLFADAARHNFRPAAGSPAIGSGLPSSLVDVDFEGVRRAPGTNDIGPFRY